MTHTPKLSAAAQEAMHDLGWFVPSTKLDAFVGWLPDTDPGGEGLTKVRLTPAKMHRLALALCEAAAWLECQQAGEPGGSDG